VIQRSPGRVLAVLVVLALAFLALGYPGRNGTATGAWMYISGVGFIAFLLTVAVVVVLTAYLFVSRARTRRGQREAQRETR
jgi:uncharacterized membrane protein